MRPSHRTIAGLLVATGHAGATQEYALSWVRGDGAESCPDRAAFVEEVSRRLGSDPFDAAARRTVLVRLLRPDGAWRAELRIDKGDGTEPATSVLETEADSCDEVFKSTALALTLALEETEQERQHVKPPSAAPARSEINAEPAATRDPRRDTAARREPRGADAANAYDNWLGLEIAQDLALFPDTAAACSPESQATGDYRCYEGSEVYTGQPHPDAAGRVGSGYIPATARLLASYERALTTDFGLVLRGGFAFGDTTNEDNGRSGFMPVHLELDARYWFADPAYGGATLNGFVVAGLGLAQVDAPITVDVADCADSADPNCLSSTPAQGGAVYRKLTAYRRMGRGFATVGVGGLWSFSERTGLLVRLAGMLMAPAHGFVLEPSVGVVAGF